MQHTSVSVDLSIDVRVLYLIVVTVCNGARQFRSYLTCQFYLVYHIANASFFSFLFASLADNNEFQRVTSPIVGSLQSTSVASRGGIHSYLLSAIRRTHRATFLRSLRWLHLCRRHMIGRVTLLGKYPNQDINH